MKFTVTYNTTAKQVLGTGVKTAHVSVVVKLNRTKLADAMEKARELVCANKVPALIFQGDRLKKCLRPVVAL